MKKVILIDYVEGRLSPADRRRVEARLAEDAEWRSDYEALVRARELSDSVRKPTAPDLYWNNFNVRLRRRLARTRVGRRSVKRWLPLALPVAAAAVILFLTWDRDLTQTEERPAGNHEAWDHTVFTTMPEYPAVLPASFEDLSNDEAIQLISELDGAVIR